MPQAHGGEAPSSQEPVLGPRAERGKRLAWLILLLSLFATLLAWQQVRDQITARAMERFNANAEEIGQCLRFRMHAFEQVVRGGQGLFESSDRVEHREWHRFVGSLRLDRYFSGVLSLSFAPWVAHEQRSTFFREARREQLGNIEIYPPGTRAFYAPVFYAEPMHEPIGFDLYSDPGRRAAMDRARHTGEVSLSTPVRMPGSGQRAVVLYAPVYRGAPRSPEERVSRLVGFVHAPLDVTRFMDDVLQREFPTLRVQVLDGLDGLLYDSTPALTGHDPAFARRVAVPLAGQAWTLRVSSLPAFEARVDRSAEAIVLGSGLTISVLLFAMTLSLASTRQRAIHLARRYTRELDEERQRMQEIAATLGEGIYVQDTREHITFVNPAAEQLLGWSSAELVGTSSRRLLGAAARDAGIGTHRHALERWRDASNLRYMAEETEFRCRDGSLLPVSVVSTPIQRNSDVVGSVVAFQDLRARKAAEEALRASQQFKALFDYSSEAMFLLERSGTLLDVNRVACESLGYTREELIGQRPSLFVSWSTLPGTTDTFEQLYASLQTTKTVVAEGEHVRKDGSRYPVEASFSAITYGHQHRVLVAARDITERKQAEQRAAQALAALERSRAEVEDINRRLAESIRELQRLSRRDGLTGIANRRHFDEYLEQEWRRAERDSRPLSLLLADVDHFKAYNDLYGHQAGDECLRRIAQTLDAQLSRSIDMVARYGGEEFVVVLPETPLAGALNIAERMRGAIMGLRLRHEASDVSEFVTVSIGVANLTPSRDTSREQLIGAADQALYDAKQGGRNRVCSSR